MQASCLSRRGCERLHLSGSAAAARNARTRPQNKERVSVAPQTLAGLDLSRLRSGSGKGNALRACVRERRTLDGKGAMPPLGPGGWCLGGAGAGVHVSDVQSESESKRKSVGLGESGEASEQRRREPKREPATHNRQGGSAQQMSNICQRREALFWPILGAHRSPAFHTSSTQSGVSRGGAPRTTTKSRHG